MPVAAENALKIDLVDLALYPARKSRQSDVFKAARGRIERLEFVASISRASDKERRHSREKRASEFLSFVSTPVSFSLSFSFGLSFSLSPSPAALSFPHPPFRHVLSRSPPSAIVFPRLALTFSFSRGKPSANVLDGRCSDSAAQCSVARRCACAQLPRSAPLFASRSFSCCPPLSFSLSPFLSPSLLMHTASHEQLSTLPRTRLLPCARYVINTFTSLALSERNDAISRRLSACVRVQHTVAGLGISVVRFAIIA